VECGYSQQDSDRVWSPGYPQELESAAKHFSHLTDPKAVKVKWLAREWAVSGIGFAKSKACLYNGYEEYRKSAVVRTEGVPWPGGRVGSALACAVSRRGWVVVFGMVSPPCDSRC
jgi:hypothetical protein